MDKGKHQTARGLDIPGSTDEDTHMNTNPDLDNLDLDQFEDFDSEDFTAPETTDTGYLSGMWNNYGFRGAAARQADDILIAHGMVQSFVNAFARDGRYAVNFSNDIQTAGTDLEKRDVLITPAPILDTDLTPEQAGLILTGLAVHEISHPRYGRRTAQAVWKAFPRSNAANRLSNLLDDVRIERRFAADYPGYAGVFEPTLRYVGDAFEKKNGGPVTLTLTDQTNIACAALRYPANTNWTGFTDERRWWTDWAARWAKEDAPKRHVEAIREALKHIADTKPEPQAPKAEPKTDKQSGQPSQSNEQGSGEQSDEDSAGTPRAADDTPADDTDQSGEQGPDANEMTDDELSEAADANAQSSGADMPDCAGSKAVDQAARANGVSTTDIKEMRAEAQQTINAATDLEDGADGERVDVAKSTRGLTSSSNGSFWYGKSDAAARFIRDALLRSRTGHTGLTQYQKRGRLDNRGLHRIASQDPRLFSKKIAPSPDRFLVWILVDASGSMYGNEINSAAQVATAIADATKHTPTMRAAVYAWSTPFRFSPANAGVVKAWESGQNTDQIRKITQLSLGGTPDGSIMGWAAKAIRREARNGETPVIIFCSDGFGDANLGQRVAEAKAAGVIVRSVAFGRISEDTQAERFGRDGYIAWSGSIIATAKPLAKMIAKLVGKDRR